MTEKTWKEDNTLYKVKESLNREELIKKFEKCLKNIPTANKITPEGLAILPSDWRD